jgi:hypothetical protein
LPGTALGDEHSKGDSLQSAQPIPEVVLLA